jgi:tetratricopeptide (TPR) repeat protein
MRKTIGLALSLAAISCLICAAHAQTASTELDVGIAAYKQGRHEEAISHFQRAIALDSNRVVPHLYLGTAYAQKYIPGEDTPDNNEIARLAIEEVEKVLTLDPTREQETSTLKSLASLYFNMKQLDKAKEFYRKVAEIESQDPEIYFTIGVIDWTEAYQWRMEQRAKLRMTPDQPLINTTQCWDVKAKNEDIVQEGIDFFSKALTLRRNYDDAMAYMNLMYRERADIQCGNKQAYDADTKTADKWVDVTMATKAKEETDKEKENRIKERSRPSQQQFR